MTVIQNGTPRATPEGSPEPASTTGVLALSVSSTTWGRSFNPDRLAELELRMWKAYYRRQAVRLAVLLVQANREQARASWPRAVIAAFFLARAAAGFGKATGDYGRFRPDIVRGYRWLGMPEAVDADAVADRELRWWVIRREIGLAAGEAAGGVIADLYATLYGVPLETVAEAGHLRGMAAEVRDRGATADPDGPTGRGRSYWPEVARLLRASYRALADSVRPAGAVDGAVTTAEPASEAASNDYAFHTVWRLPAPRDEVVAVLGDAAGLARWWPSVYLKVRVLEEGSATGVGRLVDLYTKGWLPYTLRWRFRVTESSAPDGFAIAAEGDFVGRGVWTFVEEAPADAPGGPMTRAEYDWRIRAEKGVLKTFSFAMKPIFAANHRWAMARGEESLRLEIARRHAHDDPAVLAAIPQLPGPTFPQNLRRRRVEARCAHAADPVPRA